QQQAALVDALLGKGPLPGFDESRLRAAAESLARKRRRAVAHAWPGLVSALSEHFTAYASATPLPANGGPLADGRALAPWLAKRGALREAAWEQVIAVDLRHATTPAGLVPRQWPSLKVALLRQPRRVVVGVRFPRMGEKWWALRLA